MKILFTLEKGITRDIYFPPEWFEKARNFGDIIMNETDRPMTSAELQEMISDVDVCVTHWDCPVFTDEVLSSANRLKLIAHAAGSVADFVTKQVYDHGIAVCSANAIMSESVAEGALAYILAGLRCIPQQAYELKYLHKWNKMARESRDLRNARIGMIGLGMVGRNLLPLLAPFHPEILVYDPYLDAISLQQSGMNIKQASLDDVLHWGDILTLHASLTKETKGMLNREKLALIPDGGLLVNTARSGIIVEEALLEELRSGRIHAVLDVFDHEPLPEDSMFHELDNVILMPHVAGITAKEQMSFAMLDEIERLKCGLPLKYRIPYEVFSRMTQEKYPEEEC